MAERARAAARADCRAHAAAPAPRARRLRARCRCRGGGAARAGRGAWRTPRETGADDLARIDQRRGPAGRANSPGPRRDRRRQHRVRARPHLGAARPAARRGVVASHRNHARVRRRARAGARQRARRLAGGHRAGGRRARGRGARCAATGASAWPRWRRGCRAAWQPAIDWCGVLVDLPALAAPRARRCARRLDGRRRAAARAAGRQPRRRAPNCARCSPRRGPSPRACCRCGAPSGSVACRARRAAPVEARLAPLLAAHAAAFAAPQAVDGWALRRVAAGPAEPAAAPHPDRAGDGLHLPGAVGARVRTPARRTAAARGLPADAGPRHDPAPPRPLVRAAGGARRHHAGAGGAGGHRRRRTGGAQRRGAAGELCRPAAAAAAVRRVVAALSRLLARRRPAALVVPRTAAASLQRGLERIRAWAVSRRAADPAAGSAREAERAALERWRAVVAQLADGVVDLAQAAAAAAPLHVRLVVWPAGCAPSRRPGCCCARSRSAASTTRWPSATPSRCRRWRSRPWR